MVGNVTIQGQIVGTATFDGAKISAVVTIAPPINATVVFGKSGVSVHNLLTGRDVEDVHPKESITGLTISDSPEFENAQITTLDSVADGGVIPNDEATWLGATAKSVLSYLQKLISKVFSIDSRVTALEDELIYEVLTTAPTASISITLDKNGQPFSLHECVVYLLHPSWPSNLLFLRINNISANVYNAYINVNISRFQTLLGELGGEAKVNLRYDNEVNTVIFNSMSSRHQTSGAYASVISAGFTNFGQVAAPISRIDILPSSGVIPAGTKVILKNK